MIPRLVIEKIISGGQTGADRAGLDAAILCGVPHGGWCPKGWLAEDGRIPDQYQLTETAGASYLARTERNVKHSDGTVILTLGALSGGSLRTADFARRHRKPCLHLRLEETDNETAAQALSHFVSAHGIKTLNIAGSRGNGEPGLYEWTFEVMKRVLELSGFTTKNAHPIISDPSDGRLEGQPQPQLHSKGPFSLPPLGFRHHAF